MTDRMRGPVEEPPTLPELVIRLSLAVRRLAIACIVLCLVVILLALSVLFHGSP